MRPLWSQVHSHVKLLQDITADNGTSRNTAYYIAPMHNVDGVIAGNYRTNMDSINLETQWFYNNSSLPFLTPDAPPENHMLNQKMQDISNFYSGQELLAFNLHSSNSPPDQEVFAFPHFGSDSILYTSQEIALWNKSIHFLTLLADNYDQRVDTNASGGDAFLNFYYPETWWWAVRADRAVAMTIETVYGKAGFSHWVTRDDLRELGRSFTQSVYDYHNTQLAAPMLLRQLPKES
jgi:hypothetical protein